MSWGDDDRVPVALDRIATALERIAEATELLVETVIADDEGDEVPA